MPRISIIIPIYNNIESYLKKCLESIIRQSYIDFELILVNDGSTDNSLQICQIFADKDNRIKIINKQNGGISSARNKGLEEALGEYICFVDHDDWVDDDFLEIFIKNIYDVDLVITNIKDVFPNKVISRDSFSRDILTSERFNPSDFTHNHNFVLTNLPWNKMYKKSIIEENHIRFDEDIRIGGEDLIFVLKYALCCKSIKFVNSYTYNYNRQPGNSLTLNYIKNYYYEAKKIKDAYFSVISEYTPVTCETKLYNYFRVASKAIFEEGKLNNNKNFLERYQSIKSILNFPEVKDYRLNYKVKRNKDSRFFGIIQKLMKYNQPLLLTLFLTIYFKK